MPELPEVETVRRTLANVLPGKCIESFDLLWPRTLATPQLDDFWERTYRRQIVAVRRRAKLLILEIDSGDWISVHLRMTGELLYRPVAADPRSSDREPYLRAAFTFTDGSELLFYDTRKFGRIALIDGDAIDAIDATFGVEPLEAGFTTETFATILARRRRMKSLLLDQRHLAGLGNIYADEALFLAGIHPLRQANSLDAGEVEALREAIVTVLSDAVERQGTTLRDYRSGMGEPGSNQHRLNVYGKRPGTACPRCGTALERIVVDQRTTMFCPACQPERPVRCMPSRSRLPRSDRRDEELDSRRR